MISNNLMRLNSGLIVYLCSTASIVYAAKIAPPPSETPVTVVPPITVVPPSTPNIPSAGEMEFAITPFSNMEHGWHVFEPGYRAVCSDSSGVVSTAKLTIDAAINGETTDGQGAYQGLIIRPVTQYLRAGATSGTCDLTICLDQNVDKPDAAANCSAVKSIVGGDGERALSHKGTANYTVTGTKISLQSGAPGLSAWHPAFGFAAPAKAFKDYQSPLVLDLNGDGLLALTNVWDEKIAIKNIVRFDMALEGRPTPTGWVQKSDAFLAVDSNKNGQIDNASELFGEYTNAEVLGPKTYKNGFLALATFDQNHDGVIDLHDKNFGTLLVWRDLNQNGKSEARELKSLGDHGIKSISISYKDLGNGTGSFPMNAGNEVRFNGSFTKNDGKTYEISDVWFKQRRNADHSTAMVRWMMASPTK